MVHLEECKGRDVIGEERPWLNTYGQLRTTRYGVLLNRVCRARQRHSSSRTPAPSIIPVALSTKAYVGDIKCAQNETENMAESTTGRFFTPWTQPCIHYPGHVPVGWRSLAKLLMLGSTSKSDCICVPGQEFASDIDRKR